MKLLAVILGTAGAIACDRSERRAAAYGCALCGAIGWGVGVTARDGLRTHRLQSACGDCGAGRVCGHLQSPPRCVPSPGEAGDRCGAHGGISYPCGPGLRCAQAGGARVCVALPGEGEPCFDARGLNDQCARGLTCARDLRCHRLCPDCPSGQSCNALDVPPRCTVHPLPDGARCGRYTRGEGSARTVWFGCRGACVRRGGIDVCERANPAWRGPRCSEVRCPDGMSCDVTVCVPDDRDAATAPPSGPRPVRP